MIPVTNQKLKRRGKKLTGGAKSRGKAVNTEGEGCEVEAGRRAVARGPIVTRAGAASTFIYVTRARRSYSHFQCEIKCDSNLCIQSHFSVLIYYLILLFLEHLYLLIATRGAAGLFHAIGCCVDGRASALPICPSLFPRA